MSEPTAEQKAQVQGLDSQGQRDYGKLVGQGLSHDAALDRAAVRSRVLGGTVSRIGPGSPLTVPRNLRHSRT